MNTFITQHQGVVQTLCYLEESVGSPKRHTTTGKERKCCLLLTMSVLFEALYWPNVEAFGG